MKFCIPSIVRVDTLGVLVNQVLSYSNLDIIIINNNENPINVIKNKRVEIINNGKNLGVSKSWNTFFKLCDDDDIIISNDDIFIREDTIASILHDVSKYKNLGILYPTADTKMPFSCFSINREVYNKIGEFDENFYPAYYEDTDYLLRMWTLGYYCKRVECSNIGHIIGGSISYSYSPEMADHLAKSRDYLLEKYPILKENFVLGVDDVAKNMDKQFRCLTTLENYINIKRLES